MTRYPLALLVVLACLATAALVSAQDAPPAAAETTEADPHKYVGVAKCKTCHGKEELGDQVSVWEDGPHAYAMESLESGLAKDWAREVGIDDPTTAEECVRCHTTAYGVSDDLKGSKFSHDEAVTCEACHGAGSDYRKKKTMMDHDAAVAAGLVEQTEAVCLTCHNSDSPAWSGFDYEKYVREIAHPLAEGPAFDHPMVGRDASDSSCTTCHDSIPAAGVAVADAKLSDEPKELCLACHDGPKHAGAAQHVGVLAASAAPKDAKRFPLAADGTIQCWTCHEVHGDGLAVHSTLRDGERTVASGIRERALQDEWSAVPGDAVWPVTSQTERGAMLTLPVDDGQLCAGCHEAGPR